MFGKKFVTVTIEVEEFPATPAKLPSSRYEKTLADMPMGNSTYHTPWSMWVDAAGNCWIKDTQSWDKHHNCPGGTCSMLITRVVGGFTVDTRHCHDYRWRRENRVPGEHDVPVVKFT